MSTLIGADGRPREAVSRRIAEVPAFGQADWLPTDSGWPTLDRLAAEHRRLLAAVSDVSGEAARLRDEFEAEDERRQAALRQAYLDGESADAPEVTPPEERRAALAAVEERRVAVLGALDEFIEDAIARIEAEAPAWLDDLNERVAHAEQQREQARRMLAEAEGVELTTRRVREWVERNGGLSQRKGFGTIPALKFVAWSALQTFQPRPDRPPLAEGEYEPAEVHPARAFTNEQIARSLNPHGGLATERPTITEEEDD